MTRSEFNVKSCFYTIFIMVFLVRNFVRALDPLEPNVAVDQNTIEIKSEDDFNNHVLKASDKKPVLVQFHAPWCNPCKVLTPILKKHVHEHEGKISLTRIDIAPPQLMQIAQSQGIRSVPIIGSYMDGKLADKLIGFKDEPEVRKFVQKQVDDFQKKSG